MNQKKRPRKKGATAAVLCFVAAIAIVGTYTLRDYRKSQQEIARSQEKLSAKDETEKESTKEPSRAANTSDIVNEEATKATEATENTSEETPEEPAQGSPEGQTDESVTTGSSTTTKNVNFQSADKLLWPVSGNVCMSYSMDKTVYFQTLDQYKYNPAMIISGAEGDQVIASAPGIVKSIDESAQTGTTVNVDLGNGYELFYGQLENVAVKTGDYVQAKTVLGYVNKPTKYYSVEGANVYFEMRKDGQPIDPAEFLVE